MTVISATVKVDLGPLRKFSTAVESDMRRTTNGPIRAAMKQWAARYRSFLRERFDTFSKGGGDWAPLSQRTVEGRRKGKGSKKFRAGAVSILRDTGTLFATLDPVFSGKPGALEEDIDFGIRVGYGGPMRYAGGGRATIADIASFHQEGGPRLPKREIVVAPSERVLEQMASDMDRALAKMSKETGNS